MLADYDMRGEVETHIENAFLMAFNDGKFQVIQEELRT